jgi:hypothetical protein
MPAQSQQQRRFLYATKGPAWVKKHHFDNPGPLPKFKNKKDRLRDAALAQMKQRT